MALTTYVPNTWKLGSVDLNSVVTAGNIGSPLNSTTGAPLPSVTTEQFLGEIVGGYSDNAVTNATTGWSEFIWLAVATSTTVTPGLIYTWQPATFSATVVATAVASNAQSGFPICVGINTVASNATSIQYTWFQVTGRTTVLKNATGVVVQPNAAIFVSSTTAGRVQTTASVFRTIIGIRSANAATVLSTTSTLLVYLNRPNIGPGK